MKYRPAANSVRGGSRVVPALLFALIAGPFADQPTASQTKPAQPPAVTSREAIETQKTEPAATAAEPASEARRGPAELKSLEYRLDRSVPGWARVARLGRARTDRPSTTPPRPPAACGCPRTAARHGSPIFDDQPISSIGSIAVAPSDPNVIYVGSGEANIRGNVAAGNGIYKSIDAGKIVDARVEAGRSDRHDGRAPEERGHRVRRGAGPRVRAQPRARRLPHARRRQDVAAGAEEGRGHRRIRCRHGSRRTRTSCSPASGRRAGSRGTCRAAVRAAASTSRATAATPGSRSPAMACPRASGARSAWRSRRPTAGASMR